MARNRQELLKEAAEYNIMSKLYRILYRALTESGIADSEEHIIPQLHDTILNDSIIFTKTRVVKRIRKTETMEEITDIIGKFLNTYLSDCSKEDIKYFNNHVKKLENELEFDNAYKSLRAILSHEGSC